MFSTRCCRAASVGRIINRIHIKSTAYPQTNQQLRTGQSYCVLRELPLVCAEATRQARRRSQMLFRDYSTCTLSHALHHTAPLSRHHSPHSPSLPPCRSMRHFAPFGPPTTSTTCAKRAEGRAIVGIGLIGIVGRRSAPWGHRCASSPSLPRTPRHRARPPRVAWSTASSAAHGRTAPVVRTAPEGSAAGGLESWQFELRRHAAGHRNARCL